MSQKDKSNLFWSVLIFSSLLVGIVMRPFWYTFIPMYLVMLLLLFVSLSVQTKVGALAKFLGRISFTWYLVLQNIGYSIMCHFCPSGQVSFLGFALPLVVTFIIAIGIEWPSKKIGELIKIK